MDRLVAIIGPTGVGKSRLALHLAGLFDVEIIGADSRQLYRYLDIGTDKPTQEEMAGVPHHIVDIVDPDENFSLAQYQELAYRTIRDVNRRHRLPLLVGGSGLYVWALLEGWQIPRVPPDDEFRYNLEEKARTAGAEAIFAELVKIDPERAEKIDRRNTRRIIRALELHHLASKPLPEPLKKVPVSFQSLIIGLTTNREDLYRRVDQRVDDMMTRGFISEVEKLLKMGYDLNLPSMSGIGYRQIGQLLKGELSPEQAEKKIKTETHRLIRQQYAWFRSTDRRIKWFDVPAQEYDEIVTVIKQFITDTDQD